MAIACGGTGGHLYPGMAVGRHLSVLGCEVALLVSPKEVDQNAVRGEREMRVMTLPAVGLQGGRWWSFLRGFVASKKEARLQFAEWRPDAVLAMGGFTSAPPVFAGKKLGALTFLHESNTIPGRANRWLAHFVSECFVGFEETAGRLWNPHVLWTGTPVREAFQPMDLGAARVSLGLDPDRPVLLITGGSQGAEALNQLVIGALPELLREAPELQYLHLTGAGGVEKVRAAYDRAGVRAVVRPFLSEMEWALGAATLAVSRAGASSLAEMAAMGVPAILVPYPAATDDHQYWNAQAIVRSGAAECVRQHQLTSSDLAGRIRALMRDSGKLERMRQAWAVWQAPEAAARVGDRILEWMERQGVRPAPARGGNFVGSAPGLNSRAKTAEVA